MARPGSPRRGSVRRAVVATLAIAAALLGGAVPATADLRVAKAERLSARMVEYTMSTGTLATPVRTRVLLPEGYAEHPERRYPTLYLLHGGFGSVEDWTTQGDVERITAGHDVVVVMPDAGRGGWYVDWFNGGRGGAPRWEAFHTGELRRWVDDRFRTRADRGHRAIAGLSTGGFGAIHDAAAHPDLYAFAASFSGAVDIVGDPLVPTVVGLEAQADGGGPDDPFGNRLTHEIGWRAGNPVDLAANLRGVDVALYTRDGRPGPGNPGPLVDLIERSVHDMTIRLHRRLEELDVDHELIDEGPGGHQWANWRRDLRRALPAMERTFADPPERPSPLTFRSGVRTYAVDGWRVAVDRRELHAFTTLGDADRRGFTFKGTDPATVRTPRRFRPGSRVEVRTGGRTRRVRADGAGRVRVRVRPRDGRAATVRLRAVARR